jgi:hypothetical protein
MNAKVSQHPAARAPKASPRSMAVHFMERGRYAFNAAQATKSRDELLAALSDARICVDNALLWLAKEDPNGTR